MVQFPGKPEDAEGTDLSHPITQLLQDTSLLGNPTDLQSAGGLGAVFTGPPQSVAIIEAGATALTKWWAAALGGGATVTTIAVAVKGVWSSEPDAVRIAILGSAAFILVALILTIGLMVGNDVRGRAASAAVQVRSRADVVNAFLTLARTSSATLSVKDALLVAAALQPQLRVRLTGQPALVPVGGVRLDAVEGLQVHIDNDWVSTSRIESFSTA
jgi:hypothetical protein